MFRSWDMGSHKKVRHSEQRSPRRPEPKNLHLLWLLHWNGCPMSRFWDMGSHKKVCHSEQWSPRRPEPKNLHLPLSLHWNGCPMSRFWDMGSSDGPTPALAFSSEGAETFRSLNATFDKDRLQPRALLHSHALRVLSIFEHAFSLPDIRSCFPLQKKPPSPCIQTC